jgi:crotonobetainyl-CoA:carnitine CoA-transferase CaiB-like acyl-CoA transferase
MTSAHHIGETAQMLSGYRVVELAIWVAGPAAGGLLADWGAEVIKVEPPSGDPMRKLFGSLGVNQTRVPPYELDNRGKRCIVLDLTTANDRDAMERLLATADVFVTNLRPDALERLGLDHEGVRARHPKLVYASVTGYGLEGPDRDRAGYDVGAFWARSSLAHTIVPPGQLPPSLRSGVGDHITGITITAGILAALLDRERTGEGRLVHTSLLRTGIYVNGWDIGIRQVYGRIATTRPRTTWSTPLINCYAAGDGRGFWLLGLEQDRHWPTTLASVGRTDLAEDPRFITPNDRAKNSAELIAILDIEFAKRTFDEWTALFDANDVWWAPINSLADVIADPQAEAAGAWVDMPSREGTDPYRLAASPVGFSGYVELPGEVRDLGADTQEILEELFLERSGTSADSDPMQEASG